MKVFDLSDKKGCEKYTEGLFHKESNSSNYFNYKTCTI